jgi:hypothetical protein
MVDISDRIIIVGTCWIWTAARVKGYGRLTVNKKQWPAHRYVYTELVGPVPDGLVLDHLCRKPACVNPAHLEPVTQKENTLRGVNFIAVNARKTHCKRGHPLVPGNIRGCGHGRPCLTCHRENDRYYKNRNYHRKHPKAKRLRPKRLKPRAVNPLLGRVRGKMK